MGKFFSKIWNCAKLMGAFAVGVVVLLLMVGGAVASAMVGVVFIILAVGLATVEAVQQFFANLSRNR